MNDIRELNDAELEAVSGGNAFSDAGKAGAKAGASGGAGGDKPFCLDSFRGVWCASDPSKIPGWPQ